MERHVEYTIINHFTKAFVVTVFLLMHCMMLQSQTEKYIQVLTGVIAKGDSCVVADDKFDDADKWASIEKNNTVDNLLTFELRYDTSANYFNRSFTCTVQVNIEYQTADRTIHQLKNIQLEVNYDTALASRHQGISYYKFKNAHHVKIIVNKISSTAWGGKIPPAFRLKNEIFINRNYRLDTKAVVTTVVANAQKEAGISYGKKLPAGYSSTFNRDDVSGQQTTVSWDGNNPAFPEYDFEWAFYDDYSLIGSKINNGNFGFSPDELQDIFKNNSSRVTVSLPSYLLNIIYNKGWVFHRVRGIRFDELTGERTEGAWSYAGSYNYKGASYGVIRSDGHEESLNWQYTISFAEEGKRKELVNYFDGSLRNRQQVMLNNDNTGSRAIVQENIFDAQGRAAVHVLPAPTEETSINYFHSLNTSGTTGLPYSYSDFEASETCTKIPTLLGNSSGASRYYSPLNPLKDDNSNLFSFTRYLPDAKGYPFAVNRFTPDNTGRIRAHGGVGFLYQPGQTNSADDHTVHYFYGKPQQEELDRLFGNEAGNASHYQKNMVTDANGQTSVTYINTAGKTIATALTGKNPDNVQSIPSYKIKTSSSVFNLAERNDIIRDEANLSLIYNSVFLAPAAGRFTLNYSYTPLSLQVLYGIENKKICADCYYDLLINITDDCGNAVQHLAKEAIFTEQITCDPAPTEQQGQLQVSIPQPGEFHISWQLKLSQKAINFYLDQFLVQNLSLKKEIDFQRNYLHGININACFNNCETCIADLGTEQDFISRMTGVLLRQDSIASNETDLVWMKSLYAQLLAECNLLQQGCGKTFTPCEEQVLQLKDDVSPGGQYMLYDAGSNKFTDRDINVFLKNQPALTTNVTIKGITKPFNQFTEEEVISNWKDEWAFLLLPFHPENRNNCLIDNCGKNAGNQDYDNRFLNTADVATAASRLFWFGDNYRQVVEHDPYFITDPQGVSQKQEFLNTLADFKGTGVDIMSFVRWSVYCKNKNDNNLPAIIVACPRTTTCNLEEDEWALFKVLYYSVRQELKDQNTNCTSADLFPDPSAALTQIIDPGAAQPSSCSEAALFQINNNSGTIAIQYTGVQDIPGDVLVQYFAIDKNNSLVGNAGGNVLFPAGTKAGVIKTLTGMSDLLYVINFARCDVIHPYYTKTRRNYNGINLAALSNSIKSKSGEDLNAKGLTEIIKQCNESCEQNADGWMQKLEGCTVAINTTEYNQIHDGLIAVCKGGCQEDVMGHPFGASTTTMVNDNGDKSFKDVLLRVLGQQRFSSVCNDLLLDYPAPIDVTPLYSNEVVRTLSVCGYTKLTSWKSAWQSSKGYESFADYIRKKIDPLFSLTDLEISSLLKAYENDCITALPLSLPASLSCNNKQPKTCLTCNELKDAVATFKIAYPYVSADEPGYFDLLAKYVNRVFVFNLSSVDMYNALQQCNAVSNEVVTDTVSCTDFAKALNHFSLLQPEYFTNPNASLNADNLYEIYLALWINTELHRQLEFSYYKNLAVRCGIQFRYPIKDTSDCVTSMVKADCAPQFITCCGPFAEMEKFKEVFPGLADARLLALYFSLQHTQWCTPVNLPDIDYTLPYDSLVHYFTLFRLAENYTITVRPDSLISYHMETASTCNSTAIDFRPGTNPVELPAYVICNKPLQPLLPTDDNSCINQQVSIALANAHSDYLEYIEKIKRDYRQAYYSKCLSITPALNIETFYNQPEEYHYTLFYYDQAGNLVKTIPPAGVRPVDEDANGADKMKRIKNFGLSDKDYCYEYGDAPAFNGSATITVADNDFIRQHAAPFTIEAFVNLNNTSADQVILSKQSNNPVDNKTDGYKIFVDNGKLMVSLAGHGSELWIQTLSRLIPYTRPPPFNTLPPVTVRSKVELPLPRNIYRSLTAATTTGIAGLTGSNQWIHLAVENTGDRNHPIRIYINGNLVSTELINDNIDYAPASSPALTAADIAAGTTEIGFAFHEIINALDVSNANAANLLIGASSGGLTGSIKQVRLYNRSLTATEIRNNAYNACRVPQSEGGLVLWLPLNREETAGVSSDRINQLNTVNTGTLFSSEFQPVYPVHTMSTHYYYNSLNNVTRQVSPDAGASGFFYDLAGRLVVSQNAEQKISTRGEPNNRYSYTKYDALGRITETGEKAGAAAMATVTAKTDISLSNWMTSGVNKQVNQTIYDLPNTSVVTNPLITANQNIYNSSRKRIAATIYRKTITTDADYNNATHYQYDINGNIKRLWQEQKRSVTGVQINLLKDIQYGYDLVSGKINHIIYDKDKGDQFIYKYEYDPENRLLRAYSGRDMNTLQQDAGYRYYLHGPLARMELGDALTNRIVQGVDYTYTLQGWLKGVNGVLLSPPAAAANADAGEDGTLLSSAGRHAEVAADALAYSLCYHPGDYTPIGAVSSRAFDIFYQHPAINGSDVTGKALFNGNISSATFAIAGIDNNHTRGYSYGYDQLNRLAEVRAHNIGGLVQGSAWDNGSVVEDHNERFAYDANGNITKLFRNGTVSAGSQLGMDDLAYNYYYYTLNNSRKTYAPGQPPPADAWVLTNQLAHITDAVPAANYPTTAEPGEKDIDNQSVANYNYDGIGNLVGDNAEGIAKINWTVYGKIRGITKADGTSIVYDYDAAGNRIQKEVVSGGSRNISSYIRDAQGNVMAVYEWKGAAKGVPAMAAPGDGFTGQIWLEQHLYGSGRLGMWKPGITVPATLNTSTDAVQVGSKFFELTNHLGNVLAVISDRKLAIPTVNNPSITDHYAADLISANDFTPFGAPMAGRSFTSVDSYRYGFNGKENDNDVKGRGLQQDYGMRVYDGGVGRFLSTDPVSSVYPMLTPYQFASDNPVSGIDQDGLEYSPAGKVGIFAVDNTAVQLYPDNPKVIMQQKADAPLVHLSHEVSRANAQPSFLSQQWVPANEFERQRHEINKAQWYDRDGFNTDGSPKPTTRLANNKTWNAFAANIALPVLDGFSYTGGEGEVKALVEVGAVFLDKAGFRALANTGTIKASMIRFSQNTISENFSDGRSVFGLIEKLKSGEQLSIPPIRIVEKEGEIYTLDNRRLFVHQQANIDIHYIKLESIPPKELKKKFTTKNAGVSIEVKKPRIK